MLLWFMGEIKQLLEIFLADQAGEQQRDQDEGRQPSRIDLVPRGGEGAHHKQQEAQQRALLGHRDRASCSRSRALGSRVCGSRAKLSRMAGEDVPVFIACSVRTQRLLLGLS